MENKKQKVQVWIYRRNLKTNEFEFLILLTRPDRGAFWQPVTGSVEEGEKVESAAVREALEETGLQFLGPPEAVGSPFEFESRGNRVIEYPFALEAVEGEDIELDPHEHTQWQWVSGDEALKQVAFPSNAEILRSLLKVLKKSL